MFGKLTDSIKETVSSLIGKRRLTEDNISEAVRKVRLALLDADVNYSVAKVLIKRIKEKVLGEKIIRSVSPQQQFIKVVHDELTTLMGQDEKTLNLLSSGLSVILMCGLQGSGKTTMSVKLANYLKKQGKNVILSACDLQRPAAIEQLKVLASTIQIPVLSNEKEKNPLKVAKQALKEAKAQQSDVLIVDTAGRLHVDEILMRELKDLKKILSPSEVLFVSNAATGQDAVNTALEFRTQIGMTGNILTMLDGTTRGGAAISIKEVTEQPLVFEGIGEKIEDIQLFNPSSMADRILGMGDTINLVKKAQEHMDEDESKKLEKKLRKASFNYEDYLNQMVMIKKMGPLTSIMKMIPGMGAFKDVDMADTQFKKVESIILSMTKKERIEECDLTIGRRKRIAKGSGTELSDINRLVKTFKQMKKMLKKMPNMKNLEKMMGGPSWR